MLHCVVGFLKEIRSKAFHPIDETHSDISCANPRINSPCLMGLYFCIAKHMLFLKLAINRNLVPVCPFYTSFFSIQDPCRVIDILTLISNLKSVYSCVDLEDVSAIYKVKNRETPVHCHIQVTLLKARSNADRRQVQSTWHIPTRVPFRTSFEDLFSEKACKCRTLFFII